MSVKFIGNPDIKTLQELYRAMNAEPQDKENFPIDVPEDEAHRNQLLARLLSLFKTGIEATLRGPQLRKRADYPVPGRISGTLTDGDLETLTDEVLRIFPHLDDPQFEPAVRDRQGGLVAALGGVINFHHAGGDTGATLRVVAQLVRDFKGEGDSLPLVEVPFGDGEPESRKALIASRLRSLKDASDTCVLDRKNDALADEIVALARIAKVVAKSGEVIRKAHQVTEKHAPTAVQAAQWCNVLFGKMKTRLNWKSPEDADTQLSGLLADLTIAHSAGMVIAAIDGFMASQ